VSGIRPLTLAGGIALAGALATLGIGALAGIPGDELGHLALLLLPAVALSAAIGALVAPLLMRSPLRSRLVAIALVATLVGLANLAVVASLMFLSVHEAVQTGLLLVYSMAAGIGVALAAARTSIGAVDRLAETAGRLAEGDLQARAGRLGADPELELIATALDEMAARLGASLERRAAAEAQRRDLVTAVSHDLRTPLAGLRAMVEAMDEGVVDDPRTIQRYLAEMRGAIDSLVVLVDDLFELIQLDAGALAAESERARLDDVVRSAVAACDAQATEKGLALETELNGAAAVPCSPRITRVIQNLLQNAIRHTPADGTVRVEAHRMRNRVEVVVEDSGEGIEPAALERIFDPFWRGDEARAGPGSGLGLALAKRIVEALGGSIAVESEPARGSRFAIMLPEGT
jgi:two-component system, OmpR family, sensor histidine kinase SaeS